jgi:glycosyltransferase involved in cell wall biosynthesis
VSERAVLHVLPHPGEGGERYVDLLEAMQGYRLRRAYLTQRRGKLELVPGVARAGRAARDADLVHVHGDAATIACLRIVRRHPTVITFHGLHLWRRSWGPVARLVGVELRRAIEASQAAICVSDAELGDARGIAGRRHPEKLVRIHNGIPDPGGPDPAARAVKRRELGLKEDDFAVLFAGQLEGRKGVLDLVAALSHARAKTGTVVGLIAGDGPLRGAVEAGSGTAARVLGERGDVPELLAAVDAFALPSEREGLSMALLEAMAAGVPAVVSDDPGNAEAVAEAGLVVPIGDRIGLSDAIARLAADPSLRSGLGRAARERFLRSFTAERMVEQTRGVYERALAPE